MNNTQHTQGPWKVEKPHFNYYVTYNGDIIAQVSASNNDEANARLIAAAPELLEAAEHALEHLTVKFPKEAEILHQLRAAINKAKI